MMQKRFERIILIILAIVIVVRFTQAYLDQKRQYEMMSGSTSVPDFVWRDFNSNKHTLKEFAGKVVVLHFWASWCGPCRTEFPALLRAAKILENDVVFLTISGDEDDAPVKKFLAAAKDAAGVKPDNVIYGFDPMKSVIFDVFQTTTFPETIIIDAQGKMRQKVQGAVHWTDQKVIDALLRLKNSPATVEVPKFQ